MVTFERLLEYPFICREEGSGTREVINDYLNLQQDCHSVLKVSMELGSPEAVKGAVEAGMGVSVVSGATIQKGAQAGHAGRPQPGSAVGSPLFLRPSETEVPLRVMEELLEFARAYCREHDD
jgi:DNA-binding transcriptional LysR family regulator